MANEGKITVTMTVSGGLSTGPVSDSFDWDVSKGQQLQCLSVGTTEEAVTFTDIGTNGYIVLKNEDATNYVQVGFSATVYGMRLKAGMVAVFPAEPTLDLKLKANTAACRVTIWHVGQ